MARYNGVARALHWTIAVLIIGNLLGGFLHDALEPFVRIMPLHKAVGLTVLALSLVRAVWRLTSKAPPLPADMSRWETGAAHATHFAFYLLIIALPLTGWIVASAGKYPLSWFGLFDVPKLAVTRDDALYAIGHEGHELMGVMAAVLIALHVGAALRHHFVLKDNVLRRMA
ncbi:cytochrome b [Croceicoccus ponticola]|uniref:Cytochrome b n=1 Tax=Croceicoccus ponticola TaxID=2217664 RepID=A0A437GW12_9SPHN|nr:cytochrome b [Croceicoccus ponticola]RVQ66083.1 cytochrome b [Croceicoccus ponticola]